MLPRPPRFCVALYACAGLLMPGAAVLGQQRSFISCPIVRDTKTVPCFLAEYEDELYYLGIQQDITNEFHPPQLKHEVLVEGRIADILEKKRQLFQEMLGQGGTSPAWEEEGAKGGLSEEEIFGLFAVKARPKRS